MKGTGFPADWRAPPGIVTWQTTRAGGVSTGAYAGLNLGFHVGDDPDAVAANRRELGAALGPGVEPLWLEQVHGARILRPDRGETGAADGAVTAEAGRALVVMTADCLPVLLATATGDRVGVAHAGWRGLAAGVIAAAVDAMECDPADLRVWLGPAIGPRAFEVGDEVRAAFMAIEADTARAFAPNERGRWQADLHLLARMALARSGVDAVFGAPVCTFEDTTRFFSHRREAPCGRMASLIWRQPASGR